MPSQLPLPLDAKSALGRDDFIAGTGNAAALAFIDSWPHWTVSCAALHGPAGSGKSHLAQIWMAASGALLVEAAALNSQSIDATDAARPLVIENCDSAVATPARDRALFVLMEQARPEAPVLLTGLEPPSEWKTVLPDLRSRFDALLAFPLWSPDDALLSALAVKLFADRQLRVPDTVIARMIHSLERTPAAIRAFVAEADTRSLAEGKPVNLALVRALLAERDGE
ncbi:MAG: hypothetical protein GC166_08185 [Alphaproteobacteria bacterium]|nr:hypothetical protein [Alphaproteobacteria bacterium]